MHSASIVLRQVGHDTTGGCAFALLSKGDSNRSRVCWIRARSALTQETAAPDLGRRGGSEEALPVFISGSRLKPGLRHNVCQLAPWSSHKSRQGRKSLKCRQTQRAAVRTSWTSEEKNPGLACV